MNSHQGIEASKSASTLLSIVKRHPILSYFVMVFFISWFLAFLVVAPDLLQGKPIYYFDGILMFPVMLAGPSIAGVVMTRIVDGKAGIADLRARMGKLRAGKWYTTILIPPLLTLTTLFTLSSVASPVFAPHIFVFGIGFGVLAGFLEEIGWTGYATKKLTAKYSALDSALILGAIWGLWHAPVVDFLGAAYPHGAYWLPFFLSFITIVMAIRILIVWAYSNTGSIPIAQVIHASFTGSLAVFAPIAVTPAQEVGWYSVYAATLWVVVVALIVARFGRKLVKPPFPGRVSDSEPNAAGGW